MHYDTFDLIKADPAEFVRKAEAKGYHAGAVAPGRSLQGHVTGRCPTSTRQQQEQQSGAAAVIVINRLATRCESTPIGTPSFWKQCFTLRFQVNNSVRMAGGDHKHAFCLSSCAKSVYTREGC